MMRREHFQGWLGTLVGMAMAVLPWAHLLQDQSADAWVDRGLVVISLLGVAVLVNRYAPETFPRITALAAAVRSGRRDRTAEREVPK